MTQQIDVTPPAEDAAQAAHDAAMAEKGKSVGIQNKPPENPTDPDASPTADATPAEDVAQRPDGIPEKFWDAEKGEVRVEDLAKSYTELEASRAKEKPAEEGKADEGDAADGDTPALSEAIQTAAAGYAESGEVSEDQRKSLLEAGVDENTLNTYLAGVKALETEFTRTAHETVGGEENYKAMSDWAGTLPKGEQDAFNNTMTSGTTDEILSAIKGLNARFVASEGRVGKSVTENANTPPAGSDKYESKEEMVTAMSDPRYAKDPAYRRSVQAKVGRSNVTQQKAL